MKPTLSPVFRQELWEVFEIPRFKYQYPDNWTNIQIREHLRKMGIVISEAQWRARVADGTIPKGKVGTPMRPRFTDVQVAEIETVLVPLYSVEDPREVTRIALRMACQQIAELSGLDADVEVPRIVNRLIEAAAEELAQKFSRWPGRERQIGESTQSDQDAEHPQSESEGSCFPESAAVAEIEIIGRNELASIEQVIEAWLVSLSPATQQAYRQNSRQFVAQMGITDVRLVVREDIHRFRGWLGREFGPKTINQKMSSIRGMFAVLVNEGILDRNPCDGVKSAKTEDYVTTQAITKQQFADLIGSLDGDSLPDLRDKALIWILGSMALRNREAHGLSVGDFKIHEGAFVLEVFGKGGKRRRVEFHDQACLDAVTAWAKALNGGPDDPLFPRLINKNGWQIGEALTNCGVRHIVRKRLATVGITSGITPHSFRRFLATETIAAGVPLNAVQRFLGHSHASTTEICASTTEMYDMNRNGTARLPKGIMGGENNSKT